MKSRGAVVLIAALLALAATAALFTYVRGVRERATGGSGTVAVIVSKEDIPAGTNLDEVMASGGFTTVTVPRDALVRDAVTDLSGLSGRVSSAPIVEGEQITSARLQGSTQLAGGTLGIREGFEAISLSLDMPQAAGGLLRQGDHVTVFAALKSTDGSATALTLIPDTRVLKLGETADSSVLVTLELTPLDAQRLVFAHDQGSIWLALLPPNARAPQLKPQTFYEVVR